MFSMLVVQTLDLDLQGKQQVQNFNRCIQGETLKKSTMLTKRRPPIEILSCGFWSGKLVSSRALLPPTRTRCSQVIAEQRILARGKAVYGEVPPQLVPMIPPEVTQRICALGVRLVSHWNPASLMQIVHMLFITMQLSRNSWLESRRSRRGLTEWLRRLVLVFFSLLVRSTASTRSYFMLESVSTFF